MKNAHVPDRDRTRWFTEKVKHTELPNPDHVAKDGAFAIDVLMEFETFADAGRARKLLRHMRANLVIHLPEGAQKVSTLMLMTMSVHATKLADSAKPRCVLQLRPTSQSAHERRVCPSLEFIPIAHEVRHYAADYDWRRMVMVAYVYHPDYPDATFLLRNPSYAPPPRMHHVHKAADPTTDPENVEALRPQLGDGWNLDREIENVFDDLVSDDRIDASFEATFGDLDGS